MKIKARPIGSWSPRWEWFRLGFLFSISPHLSFVIGLGFVSFQIHNMTYGNNWFDVDIYIDSALGYAGVELEVNAEGESE